MPFVYPPLALEDVELVNWTFDVSIVILWPSFSVWVLWVPSNRICTSVEVILFAFVLLLFYYYFKSTVCYLGTTFWARLCSFCPVISIYLYNLENQSPLNVIFCCSSPYWLLTCFRNFLAVKYCLFTVLFWFGENEVSEENVLKFLYRCLCKNWSFSLQPGCMSITMNVTLNYTASSVTLKQETNKELFHKFLHFMSLVSIPFF